jgi:hypothetical protein
MVFVLSDLRGTKMQKRLSAVVLALAVAVAVIGGVLATGAIARDPTQAVIGDAELAKLPVSEQRRLGQLEQGQQGLVMESLPQETRERLERDPAPDAELRVIEGYDDSLVLREADVTVRLPDSFVGSVRSERSSPPSPSGATDGVEIVMYALLHKDGGGSLSVMTGSGPAWAEANQQQLAAMPGAVPVRIGEVDAIRTGPPDQPHFQWATPTGTVISLATTDLDQAMIEAIILGVDGD